MSQNTNENIQISSEEQIVKKYDGDHIKSNVSLDSDTDFKYLVLCANSNLDINFYTKGDRVKGDIFVICYGQKPVTADIVANINHSGSLVNVFILSFIQTNELFDIQGSINLGKNISKSEGHLLEKNIVLGWGIKVKALPRLDVYSNDVKASHGVSIERINKDDLFYLRSKGLDENSSKELLIRGNIKNILDQFTEINDKDKENIEDAILSEII